MIIPRVPAKLALLLLFASVPALGEDQRLADRASLAVPPLTTMAAWSADLLYLSGAFGTRPDSSELVDGGIGEQTRQAVANLESALEEAGLDLSNVVSLDIFLADLREFGAFWPSFVDAMGGSVPAAAAVEANLALPGARVQLAMIAAAPEVSIRRIHPEGWLAGDTGGSVATLAGDTLFVSGMASFDPATMTFLEGDVTEQTRQTLDNLRAVLESANLDLGAVTRCRVFLADARDFSAMNPIYSAAWPGERPPASTTVQVGLLGSSNKFGMQCTATRSEDPSATRTRAYLPGITGRGRRGFVTGIHHQTELALRDIREHLEAAGTGLDRIVSTTIFLSDIRHDEAMSELYEEILGSPGPPRTVVGVGLMSPEATVEIEVTATASQ